MADSMAPRPALIMVAPNGARRTKADHSGLPVTMQEIVAAAVECRAAGAGAIHLHIRDGKGGHTLDAALYRKTVDAVKDAAGEQMFVQITTEAVGLYSPEEQVRMVRTVMPDAVSVALREICPARPDEPAAARFFHWAQDAGIGIQHILYSADEVYRLSGMIARRSVSGARHAVIFVLGRYTAGQQSDPADLDAYLQAVADCGMGDMLDWMVCAFGSAETACLADALARGGHVRVGFENSLWNPDGSMAGSNAERVGVVGDICHLLGRGRGDAANAASVLGVPDGG